MAQQSNYGLFVPTTNIWDVQEIYSTEVTSQAFKELLVRLYQNINNISLALNLKETGYYTIEEFLNSQVFFPNPIAVANPEAVTPVYRQVFRTVVNFGALPNTATKSLPHNITIVDGAGAPIGDGVTFTRIYGAATRQAQIAPPVAFSSIPLPYSSPVLNQCIQLNVDAVNVNVTTAIDMSAYTFCYIVLEYIKQ